MQSKPKANSIVTHRLAESGILTFVVKDAGEFTFNPALASDAVRQRAMIHGFIQRISDGAALGRDPETGVLATPNDKRARMERIADHYESGAEEWSLKPAAGAQTESGLVLLAIVRAGIADSVELANELVVALMAKRKVERRAALDVWAATKKVADAMAKIRAERAAQVAERADLDSDALLDELLAAQAADGDESEEDETQGEEVEA